VVLKKPPSWGGFSIVEAGYLLLFARANDSPEKFTHNSRANRKLDESQRKRGLSGWAQKTPAA
jgi:hypothetical protein